MSSYLQQVNKSSTLKRDLKTSQRDAKLVEMLRRMPLKHQESSLQQYAPSVADADPADRDENVAYYLSKLDELRKKFAPFTGKFQQTETQPEFDF